MYVKVIKSKAGNTLVEWMEDINVYRAWLPYKDVVNGEVKSPEKGVPYGDDFTPLIKPLPTVVAIVQALHNNGLWTMSDVKLNPALVWSGVAMAFNPIINTLVSGELVKDK